MVALVRQVHDVCTVPHTIYNVLHTIYNPLKYIDSKKLENNANVTFAAEMVKASQNMMLLSPVTYASSTAHTIP
jgi:hypothetical protein